MAVVWQHFSTTMQWHSAGNIPSLVPHGYVAVDLFFVLSGFIMSYTYLDDFRRNGLGAFATFLQRRIARLLPLNLAVLALILLAGALGTVWFGENISYFPDHLLRNLLVSVTMVQGLGIGTGLNGPAWSISVEFVAYLLFPGFVALMFHRSRLLALTTTVLAVAALTLMAMQGPRLTMANDNGVFPLIRCFTEFVMGMACFRVFATLPERSIWQQDGPALVSGLLAGLFMVLGIDLLAAFCFPPLILALACNQGRVKQWFGWPVPYFLGEISFSLYLAHDMFRPFYAKLVTFLHPLPLAMAPALAFAFFGGLLVIAPSTLLFTAVERPGRRLLRHIFTRG